MLYQKSLFTSSMRVFSDIDTDIDGTKKNAYRYTNAKSKCQNGLVACTKDLLTTNPIYIEIVSATSFGSSI